MRVCAIAIVHDRGMSANAEYQPESGGADLPPEAAPKTAPESRPAMTGDAPDLSSRTGYAWVGLVVGALILVVLLIFILQNLDTVEVSLFFWDFHLPIGVTVLLSVIAGALVMALVGGVRILQLRRAVKH